MTTTRPSPHQIPPSLLLLILDLHPLSWSLLSAPPPPANPDPKAAPIINKAPSTNLGLTEFIEALLVFLKAHLAGRWGNGVVVYGASAGRAKLLYPPHETMDEPLEPKSNTFQPFRHLDQHLENSIRTMMAEEQERFSEIGTSERGNRVNETPAIVSALTKALCFINRQTPPPPPPSSLTSQPNLSDPNDPTSNNLSTTQNGMSERTETRIMIINATPGGSSVVATGQESMLAQGDGTEEAGNGSTGGSNVQQKATNGGKTHAQGRGGYVGLMNCVFAAQKGKIPIDILTLPPPHTQTPDPIFLQQASYLTSGIYWRWNGRGGLLQYLHGIYLPPPSLRLRPFTVPPQEAVDFRAVCFCHQEVVDVGFVCSVCLSIFCEPRPVCLMCKTKFPIKSLPALKALAAGIQPITIPDTEVPKGMNVVPKIKIGGGGRKSVSNSTVPGSGSGSGSGLGGFSGISGGTRNGGDGLISTGSRREEAIEID